MFLVYAYDARGLISSIMKIRPVCLALNHNDMNENDENIYFKCLTKLLVPLKTAYGEVQESGMKFYWRSRSSRSGLWTGNGANSDPVRTLS